MHPDDFKAYLAWVTAKRFCKLVVKESFFKKTLDITGSADEVYTLLNWNKKRKISVVVLPFAILTRF